ncbi:putative splicing factor, arginine/serine-rich 7 [Nymphon striatum]|nr:putative splicing factor, arginine/serine-rich 7 [Nymphon striatum]
MTRVIQVTNIAPATTKEQMLNLFSFLGRIEDLRLYNSVDAGLSPKICYVKYSDSTCVGIAQHLTKTVFLDRALVVVPYKDDEIPDELTAIATVQQSNPLAAFNSNQNTNVVSQIQGVGSNQVIITYDPKLQALGLPDYPPLPASMDHLKVEEIRRTVHIGNIMSTATPDQLLTFFNQIGEVKYIRMAGDSNMQTRYAYVEFTEQGSIANALQYNGVMFQGRPLLVNHSNNAIIKPETKNDETAERDIEEAMKRVKEAQSLISAAIEPELAKKKHSGSRSRSRSRSHRRSKSRSPHRSGHRSRSRSHGRRRRSRSPRRRSRSRSRDRRRRRSPSPRTRSKRSRSRSPKKKNNNNSDTDGNNSSTSESISHSRV